MKGVVKRKKILAVASGGGHWVQLLRLRPAFEDLDVAFVTVDERYGSEIPDRRFYVVNDATRWNKFGLVLQALRVAWIVLLERPHVIVSTGASPGYFALLVGKLTGVRTAWIDSIANADRLSLSGERVGRFADLWLTQWEHLATSKGPFYRGSVL